MSVLSSENAQSINITELHPDWVSMDIGELGKSFYNGDGMPLNDIVKGLKAKTLKQAIAGKCYSQLVEYLRTTEGLINDELRAEIWPLLLHITQNVTLESERQSLESSESSLNKTLKLGLNTSASTTFILDDLNSNDLPAHRDEEQVKLDIQRSFTIVSHLQALQSQLQNESYANIYSKEDLDELKKKLLKLIVKMLRKYPSLNYYQGYHDVASIVMIIYCKQGPDGITVNEEMAFKVLEKLTLFHLRDYMIKDISLSTNHLKLIPSILEDVDSDLFELLKQTSHSYILSNGSFYDYNFYQGISSILTIFSHDLLSIQYLLIVWDFFLSYESVLVNMYIYVAALMVYKDDIFNKLNVSRDQDISYLDVDQDIVHTLLSPSKLFGSLNEIDLIKILNQARILIETHLDCFMSDPNSKFHELFSEFNPNSVLVTSSSLSNLASINDYNYLLTSSNSTTSDTLADIIKLQDAEIKDYNAHNALLEARILEKQDTFSNSSLTEYENSHANLLSSSVSSLTSASSTINLKIMNTSSYLFKKIFETPSSISPDPEDRNRKATNNHNYVMNIYKTSFTIGFVGFMIHFLLVKNNLYLNQYGLVGFGRALLSPVKDLCSSILSNNSMAVIASEISTFTEDALSATGDTIHVIVDLVRNSDFVHGGMGIYNIGLGTLRESIFGFSN